MESFDQNDIITLVIKFHFSWNTPANSLMFFSRPLTSDLADLDGEIGGLASPKSPVSALTESKEAEPGSDTTTMHFLITTKLGWIPWKEREASLFSLFERGFAATRCELKFSDMLNELAMEVEIPNTQIVRLDLSQAKFEKYFIGKALATEIDKLHGIEPALCRWKDVYSS